MKIADFYGERIRSKYHGEGTLTQIFGKEIHVTYDKGESYVYTKNAFASGTLEFLKPELLEVFNKAYEEHIKSKEGRIENFEIWMNRGS